MSFRKPQTILRMVPGQYIDGVWIPGAETPITIQASVQPLSDTDLINLPAGRRASDVVKLYTITDLFTTEDMGQDQQPDKLVWRGTTYEISSKSVRQSGVIDHYRYWATKVQV